MEGLFDRQFSFGNIVVSPQTHSISLAGKQKRLEPRLLALLIYLAQHAQQVITRQQITATIWPDVIVGEESITQAIFALRNALGDNAKNPKYIETIPKKGYRFLAEVALVPAAAEQQVPAREPSRQLLAFGGGLILCLVALLYTLSRDNAYEIAHIVPVTKMSGAECCIAINHDRKLAFLNILDNQSNLYVKDLDRGIQERITQDAWQKGTPAWLDGNTLIYPRCLNGECQVVQQSLQQSPQILYSSANYIGEIALAPGDPELLLINEQSTDRSEFITLDLRSGKHEKLRDKYPELPVQIIHPVFSPDRDQLYFVNIDTRPMILMALDLASAKISLVSDQFSDINSLSFDHRQQLLIAGMYQSTMGLWQLASAGQQPTLLLRSSGSEQFLFPLMDPVERSIYYQSVQLNYDIGMATGTHSTEEDFSELNATGTDDWAVLSADEQFLYFVSDRSGSMEVWRYDLAKKQTKPVTQLKTSLIKLLVPSQNGQRFAAIYMDKLQPRLGIFAMHSGKLLASLASLSHPLSWSNNDKYIYVEELRNKVPSLMRYDSQTLAAVEIEQNAGAFAQESKDGNSLLFVNLPNNSLMEKNLATGETKTRLTIDANVKDLWPGQLRLDSSQTSLLIAKQTPSTSQLWRYPLTGSDLTAVKMIDLPARAQVIYINPEGSKVTYGKQMPANGDIMKIELK